MCIYGEYKLLRSTISYGLTSFPYFQTLVRGDFKRHTDTRTTNLKGPQVKTSRMAWSVTREWTTIH